MGMYRKEWSCCGSVTETESWEPDECPFCTTPPYVTETHKRTWEGLTVGDKMAFLVQDFGGNRLDAMDWAEERLKEKNNVSQ